MADLRFFGALRNKSAGGGAWSWLPNSLTMLRVALAPVLTIAMLAIWTQHRGSMLGPAYSPWLPAVGALLIFAGLLDFLDGWIARTLNAQSAFGEFWDPLADKLVIGGTLVGAMLIFPVLIPAALSIILRDIGVTALRLRLGDKVAIRTPGMVAKVKTALEFIGLAMMLLWSAFFWMLNRLAPEAEMLRSGVVMLASAALYGGIAIVYVAAILAVWTGGQYAWRARQSLSGAA